MAMVSGHHSDARRGIVFLRSFLPALLILALTGCASVVPLTLRQSLSVVVPHKVDFTDLEYYALRSKAAYASESEIRNSFPDVTRVKTVKSINVRYFIETDRVNEIQTLSFRGTANKPNVWQDIESTLTRDNLAGMHLHRGFRDDSRTVYADLLPHLRKDHTIRVTGHSLGGAIAMIVGFYLDREGYNVERLVTFGQPKVTNYKGQVPFAGVVTRVADGNDVVPMLPPGSIRGAFVGSYRHIGPEVILLDDADYIYLDAHVAERLSVDQFWRSLTNFSGKKHHMERYLANIEEKSQNGARQVPYFPWE